VIGASSIGNPGPSWQVEGTGNLFGNGLSDIVWHNDNGAVAVWEMNGTTVICAGSIANPGPSWHVMGNGNYHGAGQNDILFQNTNGAVAVWEVQRHHDHPREQSRQPRPDLARLSGARRAIAARSGEGPHPAPFSTPPPAADCVARSRCAANRQAALRAHVDPPPKVV